MKAIYKVPNGKLLKVSLERDNNNNIQFVKITGDFFTYPEENIEHLEKYLIGATLSPEALKESIEDFLRRSPTEFFGLDVESLIHTIMAAAQQ